MARARPVRPAYNEESEDELVNIDGKESDDELTSISFETLNSAQKEMEKAKGRKSKKKKAKSKNSDSDSDSDSDSASESEFDAPPVAETIRPTKHKNPKLRHGHTTKKNKHAPSEASSKRPVSKVRDIQGLNTRNESTLYTDIRFDPAYGVADLSRTRKDYAFLDDYRQQEIKSMQSMLKDRKSAQMMLHYEREDIEQRVQSLKSRLDTMKNKDLQNKILADHKHQQVKNFNDGKSSTPYFLKKSEQRKLLQKAKFDSMKASQREKVMERKRKKRLGKEFRQLEFNGQSWASLHFI